MDGAMKGDVNSLPPSNLIPRGQDLDHTSNEDSMTSGSLSPLRSDEKVQSRYLGPHVASCHDYCKYGKKHDPAARRLNFRKFMRKKLAQEAEKNQATKPKATSKVESGFLDTLEVSDPQTLLYMKKSTASGEKKTPEASEESRTNSTSSGDERSKEPINNKTKTQRSVKTPISPVAPTVIRRKAPKSLSEAPKIKQKAPLPLKRVDVATKPAMTLKTRAPLSRSLSKRKSSRSLIHRRNQESEIMVSPGSVESGDRVQDDKTTGSPIKSRIGEATLSSPPPASFPPKTPHDHSSSLQLRKLRSIKRTSTSRDNVSGLQLRKVSSIKRTSTLHDNISGLQLRRLRSAKRNSTQNVSVPSLRLKKLRSIKRTSAPRDNDSSLQSIKRTSAPHESVQSLQPKKLESMKRTSTPNHESAPGLQLKKLGSIKRTSMSHGSASSLQLRKLPSIKRTSKPRESDPRLQLKKLGSIKKTSTPHESVPSLQLKKLGSIKRISTPHESVSSSQPTKLSNVKQTTAPHGRILSYLPRKLRSMKRSLSVKDKHNVEKPNVESKSRNIDEESKRAISGVGDDDNKRMGRIASTRAEDNTSAPVKLKFRSGKIINLRSDSKGARNLWLNIGKLASENPIGNGLLRRRSSRRRRDNASFGSKSFDPDVQSIALKHQDVMEKKDAKSLFNDVIQETASKLVKTRKSKVKALVGAFETVISLLDSRPASVVRV